MITFENDIEKQDWQHAFKLAFEDGKAVCECLDFADSYIRGLRLRAKPAEAGFRVTLESVPSRANSGKLNFVKVLRDVTAFPLVQAAGVYEAASADSDGFGPQVLFESVALATARKIAERLRGVGACVLVERAN